MALYDINGATTQDAPRHPSDGHWVWVEIQVLSDGRCGAAVDGTPMVLRPGRQSVGRPVELVIQGYAHGTQTLEDSVEVHQGVLHPEWWSALDARRMQEDARTALKGAAPTPRAGGSNRSRLEPVQGVNPAFGPLRCADDGPPPSRLECPMRLSSTSALAILTMAVGSVAFAQGGERFTISGSAVALYNLAGRVDLVAGAGGNVSVAVTRGGADAQKLRIEQGTRDGANDLRVVYPDDDIVYPALGRWSNSSVSYSRDGYFNGDGESRWNRVRIRSSGSGTEAWADLRVEVPAGKTVTVNLAVGEVVATNVKGRLRIDVGAARVQARGHDGALSIDAGSGGVVAEDVTGDLEIDTGSGGVELANITGGRVTIETGSGGVRGTKVTASEFRVDVGSGGIDLGRVSAERATIDAGSGATTVEFVNSPKSLNVDTGSGGVELTFPASLSADIEVETGSGRITSDFAVTVDRFDRRHVRGRIGGGEGKVRVETGSGGVRILKK